MVRETLLAPVIEKHTFKVNSAPPEFAAERELPGGFLEFLQPLHEQFTPRQRELAAKREDLLADAHRGRLPGYLPASPATTTDWKIELPAWCRDQRNQMTGPADEADMVVKMLNSGAPGVMLDLEDSLANYWPNIIQGIENILAALRGELSYDDEKRGRRIGIQPSETVIWIRPRGLHLHQGGVLKSDLLPAPLFDLALIAYQIEAEEMKHPLAIYIPKTESAEEALWWRDLFQAIARRKRWPRDYIKCMALVESHPLAFQMEEFSWNLRDHLLGLNLGRWDYMASLIDFTFEDPQWVLPDRNTIPHDVAFFQNLRTIMPEVCHKHGLMAIGGMTALYPSRRDPELNERALKLLEQDKRNEARSLMDGAWTGHPDQNQIAVDQFPAPNQLARRPANIDLQPDLRPVPAGVGKKTLAGTRAAIRTAIRYRNGVLNGKGASLLDGYMEDLATDRIYRLMIAQRIRHRDTTEVLDDRGQAVEHTPELITRLYDEELDRILRELPADADEPVRDTYYRARRWSEEMIRRGEFTPV